MSTALALPWVDVIVRRLPLRPFISTVSSKIYCDDAGLIASCRAGSLWAPVVTLLIGKVGWNAFKFNTYIDEKFEMA